MLTRLPITLNTAVLFSTNKNSLTYNIRIFKIRKLILTHYYHRIRQSYSSLAKCPNTDFRGNSLSQNHVLPFSVMSLNLQKGCVLICFFLIFSQPWSFWIPFSFRLGLSVSSRSDSDNASLEKSITGVMYLQDILSEVQDFGLSHLGWSLLYSLN